MFYIWSLVPMSRTSKAISILEDSSEVEIDKKKIKYGLTLQQYKAEIERRVNKLDKQIKEGIQLEQVYKAKYLTMVLRNIFLRQHRMFEKHRDLKTDLDNLITNVNTQLDRVDDNHQKENEMHTSKILQNHYLQKVAEPFSGPIQYEAGLILFPDDYEQIYCSLYAHSGSGGWVWTPKKKD